MHLVDDLLGNGCDSSGAEPVGVHEDVWHAGPARVQILQYQSLNIFHEYVE